MQNRFTWLEETGKRGPYQKGAGSGFVEEMMRDLMNPALNCRFKYLNNSVTLTVEDKKTGEFKPPYYLVPLLQSADLPFVHIDKAFLDFFVARCNQFKKVLFDKPDTFKERYKEARERFEEDFKQTIKKQLADAAEESERLAKEKSEESKEKKPPPPFIWEPELLPSNEELFAFEYAITAYTTNALTARFNTVLRDGDIRFASQLDEETLQEHMFYLFGATLLYAVFEAKIPNTEEVTSFRIEHHIREFAKTLPLVQAANLAAEHNTNTVILRVPYLTSTSQNRMEIITAIDKNKEPKIITNEETDQFFVFQFRVRKKLIKHLSEYKGEEEILLPPSGIKFTSQTVLDGPVVIWKGEVANPLEAENQISYPLHHAMQYVLDQFYSHPFKDADIYSDDYQIKYSDGSVIYKPNHGLAHAIRQARNVEDTLNYLSTFAKAEYKQVCDMVLENPQLFEITQIAMLFYSCGRENERRDDSYDLARSKASERFFEYMKKFYIPHLKSKNVHVKKFIEICAFILNYLDDPRLMHPISKSDFDGASLIAEAFGIKLSHEDMQSLFTMCHVLVTSHNLDIPRHPVDDTTPQEITRNKLLAYGILKPDLDEKEFNKATEQLWANCILRIKQTGDRLYETGKKDPIKYASLFHTASLNPRRCAELVGLNRTRNPIVLCPQEELTVRDEAGLKFIYYLLDRLIQYPDKIMVQFEHFLKKDSKYFWLFTGGIQFLAQHKDYSQTAEELKFNKQIQEACFIRLMSKLKSQSPDPEFKLQAFLDDNSTLLNWARYDSLHTSQMSTEEVVRFYFRMEAAPGTQWVDEIQHASRIDILKITLGGFTPLEYAFYIKRGDIALHLMQKFKAALTEKALVLFFKNPSMIESEKILGYFTVLTPSPFPIQELVKTAVCTTQDEKAISTITDQLSEQQLTQTAIDAVNAKNYHALEIVLYHAKFNSKQKDADGMTVLHHAAKLRDMKAMELLTLTGSDINAANQDGNTPLHLLLLNTTNNDRFLIAHLQGVDIHAKNKEGLTPLDMLLQNTNLTRSGDIRTHFYVTINYLLQNNAKFNLQHCKNPHEMLFVAFKTQFILHWRTLITEFLTNDDAYLQMTEMEKSHILNTASSLNQRDALPGFFTQAQLFNDLVKIIDKKPSEEKKSTAQVMKTLGLHQPEPPLLQQLGKLRIEAEKIKDQIHKLTPTINATNASYKKENPEILAVKLTELVKTIGEMLFIINDIADHPEKLQKTIKDRDYVKLLKDTKDYLTDLMPLRKNTYSLLIESRSYQPDQRFIVLSRILSERMKLYEKLKWENAAFPKYFSDTYLDDIAEEVITCMSEHKEFVHQMPKISGQLYKAFSILPELQSIRAQGIMLLDEIMKPHQQQNSGEYQTFNAAIMENAPDQMTDAKTQPSVTKKP